MSSPLRGSAARFGLELLLYLVVIWLPLRDVAGQAVGVGVDLSGSIWFQEWMSYCVRHGYNPVWTPWFFHPGGLEIFTQTGFNFLDALVAVPFLWAFGSPDHMVPTTATILLGNAVAMRMLLRSMGLSRPACVAGALVFAMHPFVVFELNEGRPTQAMLWFWPLALKELFAMAEDPRWRRPILAGLFIALQGWTYWFTAHFFALAIGPMLVVYGWKLGRDWWKRVAVAGGVALLFALPAAIPMFLLAQEGRVPGISHGFDGFGLEEPKAMGLTWWIELLPVKSLVLAGLALVLSRNRWPWIVGVVAALLLAPGSIYFLGELRVSNPFWAFAEWLPGFPRFLFPYRIWAVIALVGGIAVADSLDRFLRPPLLAWAAVLPVVWLGVSGPGGTTHLYIGTEIPRPAYVDRIRAEPGVVLDLPFPCAEEAVYFQPMHGQPLIGGMTETVPALRPAELVERVRRDSLLAALADAALGADPDTLDISAPEGLKPPVGEEGVRPRWVVLHMELLRRSDQVRGCWQRESDGPIDQVARESIEKLIGPPHVEDREAAAWDLSRL